MISQTSLLIIVHGINIAGYPANPNIDVKINKLMEQFSTIPAGFQSTQATLEDKVVFITGATSDFGHAVTMAIARAGGTVLFTDRKQRNMTELYDSICDQGCKEPMMIEFDMLSAQATDFAQLGSSLLEQFPQIHGLVHCAIWGAPLAPIANADMGIWGKVFDQQLIRPMSLTQALLPGLINADQASIIFTVMETGRQGRAYWGPVSAAFAGIENCCETLSAELSDHQVRVNSLDPGKVKTTIRKQFYPGESSQFLRDPAHSEITDAYVYLLCDASKNLSAQRFTLAPLEE